MQLSFITQTPFVSRLSYTDIIALIRQAQQQIVLCLPNIHVEIAKAVAAVAWRVPDVRVILDPSEANFRNGYGDIEAVTVLKRVGVSLFEMPQNMVSFLICDGQGYFLFPQSRIFAEEGQGNNAVTIDRITQLRLLAHFFPPQTPKEQSSLREQLAQGSTEQAKMLTQATTEIVQAFGKPPALPLNEQQFAATKASIEQSPPLHPDLKRRLNVYTAKIQLIEISFTGSKFQNRRLPMPKNVLPIRNLDLQRSIDASLRLFDNVKTDEAFAPLSNAQQQLEEIKRDHMKRIASKDKYAFLKEEREPINQKLKALKDEVSNLQKLLIAIIARELLTARKRVGDELQQFFMANRPKQFENYPTELLEPAIEKYVQDLLSRIPFPDPITLLGQLQLTYNFYDVTYEDLKDRKFLEELRECELIGAAEFDEILSETQSFAAYSPR